MQQLAVLLIADLSFSISHSIWIDTVWDPVLNGLIEQKEVTVFHTLDNKFFALEKFPKISGKLSS